jgi:hypothetical protein
MIIALKGCRRVAPVIFRRGGFIEFSVSSGMHHFGSWVDCRPIALSVLKAGNSPSYVERKSLGIPESGEWRAKAKSETRRPKAERRPKPEGRATEFHRSLRTIWAVAVRRQPSSLYRKLRRNSIASASWPVSDFVLRTSLDLRPSGFGFGLGRPALSSGHQLDNAVKPGRAIGGVRVK